MTAEVLHPDQDLGIEEDIYSADGEEMEGEEEDIDFVNTSTDEQTQHFDHVVGVLSDILLEPQFEQLRENFCRENCKHFEETDENKLIYTNIFSQYTSLLEANIEARLKAAVPGFDMQSFLELLDQRKDELMSDVFDLLLSLGDFETFRDLMLSYKKEVDSQTCGLQIQCHAVKLHAEDQEDGDERPDLDFSLTIKPVSNPGVRCA